MSDPPPRKPEEHECCGCGCTRCVFDIYEEEYRIWERRKQTGVSAKSTLSPEDYTELVITKISPLSSDTNLYILSHSNGKTISGLQLGQHVILRGTVGQETVCRPYTPVDYESSHCTLSFAIKLYDNGLMSSAMKHWKVGTKVHCRGPTGNLVEYTCNEYEHIILIAAGTGITPMLKLIQTILQNEEDETIVILIYACRKYEDILFKDEIDAWTDYWNFHVFYFLSQDCYDAIKPKKRHKDKISCRKLLSADIDEISADMRVNFSQAFSFICGPPGFEGDVESYIMNTGLPPSNVYRF